MLFDDLSQVSLAQLTAAHNWQHKYRLLTDWGKLIGSKPEIRTADNLIKGCETPVWLVHSLEQGRHRFSFDGDSRVMNGLAAVFLSLIDNKTAEEMAQLDWHDLLHEAGLEKHLTPSRNNGFNTIMARAYQLASIQPAPKVFSK